MVMVSINVSVGVLSRNHITCRSEMVLQGSFWEHIYEIDDNLKNGVGTLTYKKDNKLLLLERRFIR